MPSKTLGLTCSVTMDQTKENQRLWCLWAVLRGAEEKQDSAVVPGEDKTAVHPEQLLAYALPNRVPQWPSLIQVMQAEHHHHAASLW